MLTGDGSGLLASGRLAGICFGGGETREPCPLGSPRLLGFAAQRGVQGRGARGRPALDTVSMGATRPLQSMAWETMMHTYHTTGCALLGSAPDTKGIPCQPGLDHHRIVRASRGGAPWGPDGHLLIWFKIHSCLSDRKTPAASISDKR